MTVRHYIPEDMRPILGYIPKDIRTIRRYVPENIRTLRLASLHSHCCESLKPYAFTLYLTALWSSNAKLIDEWGYGKNVEGSGHGLFQVTILTEGTVKNHEPVRTVHAPAESTGAPFDTSWRSCRLHRLRF
jgi:hypothetical protein